MVKIANKVVIVSEWHPWELFAKDVAEIIRSDLHKTDTKDITVETYRGPLKRSLNPQMSCRNGNLWKFINKYRPLDYTIILHNNFVSERDFQEYAKYHPKAELTKSFKESFKQEKDIRLHYLSRTLIPSSLEHRFASHLKNRYDKSYVQCESWPHACFDNPYGLAINTNCRYFPPKDYDAIHIELFRPDSMDKQQASNYVLELALLLSDEGLLPNSF